MRLCVFTVLREYLDRTEDFRTSDQPFVSYAKPRAAIATNTLQGF